ncbi:type I-C CRISPR-associated protein Cas8c/Csd1 [Pelagicoccus sp. SDUM812002]|uniref:type I-C CRISPR-associated protein Cas8c/Csd1 n=1 Tax=Pelagicoccus sp. SDUM812002 TaxID=3041266 RepID=UPI00280F4C3C|nr:type I-C CRISPR-associated protein Cas8c/Csd1 [Pelagicoccus sp. SDUM812002]MDQ8187499.1 type I-C CRISPR-associated protein Cas8c/Csd1 [Pelagicoccus sp. SDUM812002]
MILQSLYELYGRLADDPAFEISEPGFSPQKISFKIWLHPSGELHDILDARKPNEKGKMLPDRIQVLGESKPSGSGINPCFLWDNQTYLLGRTPDGKDASFAQLRFEGFREKHLAAEEEINSESFGAVCRFLEKWSAERLSGFQILNEVGTGFGVFQMVGATRPVHESEDIKRWWRENLPSNEAADMGQCLLTGESAPIARLHPKIKGIAGAQSAGASLVSFNDAAYESYGKTQSYNSPVGEDAAFRYGTALNAMLNGPKSHKHRMRIGDTTCVFWTDRESLVEDIFAEFASDGSHAVEQVQDPQVRQKLEVFLKALRQGREADAELDSSPDATRFYLLGLAPNAARLSVRFFYQSSLSELLSNLRAHRRDLEIIREFESPVGKRRADSDFPAYWEFLRETVRQGDDPSPLLGGAMLRSILEATPYPESLFTAILRRVHIERSVNYIKAAAIKSVLVRNHKKSIHIMLDQENKESSYLLGRLFAILEKIQEEGHREQTGRSLDKTIRETYFSTACSTPAAVFSRIEQLSTHHRRHLNPGRKVQFDRMIADVKWPQEPSVGIKKSHNLEEQGLFILGYYHQRRSLFSKVEADSAVATA